MIILIYGNDTYRSRRKLNKIVDYYKKDSSDNLILERLEGKDLDFKKFKNKTKQVSMFNERKLMILEGIFQNQQFKEKFMSNIEIFENSQDIFIFYENGKVLKSDRLFKLINRFSKSEEFNLLSGDKLMIWVKNEISSLGIKITNSALEKIVDFVGNDLWRFSNEIKKLYNYKNGDKIKEDDVELLVKPKIDTDIFKTIDAFAVKDKKKAIISVHNHLEKGDSPLYILSMINYQIRNLLIVGNFINKGVLCYDIARESGLHPYTVRKSCFQIKKFKIEDLKNIYQKILEVDINIKTGRLDTQTALDLLIAEI